jgi:hypothetical protein
MLHAANVKADGKGGEVGKSRLARRMQEISTNHDDMMHFGYTAFERLDQVVPADICLFACFAFGLCRFVLCL